MAVCGQNAGLVHQAADFARMETPVSTEAGDDRHATIITQDIPKYGVEKIKYDRSKSIQLSCQYSVSIYLWLQLLLRPPLTDDSPGMGHPTRNNSCSNVDGQGCVFVTSIPWYVFVTCHRISRRTLFLVSYVKYAVRQHDRTHTIPYPTQYDTYMKKILSF